MKRKEKRRRRRRRIAPAGLFLISLFALGGVWFADAVYRAMDHSEQGVVYWEEETTENILLEAQTVPQQTQPTMQTTEPTETTATTTLSTTETILIQDAQTSVSVPSANVPSDYTTVPLDEARVHEGNLLQIDALHSYNSTAGELVTFHGKNECYRMKRMDLQIRPEVLTAMNTMASDYVAASGTVDLMVYSTTAAYDVAGSLYPNTLPDRSTGFCIDLCKLNPDETINSFKEPNAWVQENCWKYGFVFSYPQADTEVSGMAYAPYHLRYIGELHAGIMHEKKLTLAGYFEELKKHSISVPLKYTVGETEYSIYYVPAGPGSTEVPVPLNKDYEVSGNNSDGFIITVKG